MGHAEVRSRPDSRRGRVVIAACVAALAAMLLTLELTTAAAAAAPAHAAPRHRAADPPCTDVNAAGTTALTIDASQARVFQGTNFRYTVNWTNINSARNLWCIQVVLPLGFTYHGGLSNGTSTGGSVPGKAPTITTGSDGRERVTWDHLFIPLTPDEVINFSFLARVRFSAPVTGTPVTVDASLSNSNLPSGPSDQNGAKNPRRHVTGQAPVTVLARAPSLTLARTPPLRVFTNGGSAMTYTWTVHNASTIRAFDVVLTNQLPAGFQYVSSSGATCTAQGSIITCPLGDVAGNGDRPVDITVKAVTAPSGVAPINGSVSADGVVPESGRASAWAFVVGPGVSIAKAPEDEGIAGKDMNWTITVGNGGPGTATGAVVSDTLPRGLTFVSGKSATTGVDVTCTGSGQSFTCDLPPMAASDVIFITVATKVAPDIIPPGNKTIMVTNAAQVVFHGTTRSTTAPAEIRGEAFLTASKSATPNPATVGHDVTFHLGVHNAGPSNANHVLVTDPLPAGMRFVPTQSDPSCALVITAGGRYVVCHLDTLAPDSKHTFKVVAHLGSAGTFVNVAGVTSEQNNANEDPTSPPVRETVISRRPTHRPTHRPSHRPTHRAPPFTG